MELNGFTPSERRGILLLAAILLLGAILDFARAHRVPETPAAGPVAPPVPVAPAPPADSAAHREQTPVRAALDLNRASADDLDALPGVGPVLARRILEHRSRHGDFRSVEELAAVRGIGPALIERLRPLVCCESQAAAEPTRR